MAIDAEEMLPRKPKQDVTIGQDISALSAAELEERIRILEGEIRRARDAINRRGITRSAADAIFKR